jgi:hypothetical protein
MLSGRLLSAISLSSHVLFDAAIIERAAPPRKRFRLRGTEKSAAFGRRILCVLL